MLLELRVENLLLIEQAQLRLSSGLNVLTGETGAGKTVLAHALDLLLGGRARTGIVRPGAEEAYVEGVFELPSALPEQFAERLPADAQEVVLARRVGADGRTRAYLNGRAATVGELRDLGGTLMSFYGQHEHRKLTISSKQLGLLDELCGAEQTQRLHACAEAFAETRRLQGRLEELRELEGARERELDLLEFELGEIDAAEPDAEERERLLARRERLRRADALSSAAGLAAEALAPDSGDALGVANRVASASASLDALVGVDPRLDALGERLRALGIEAEDLAAELHSYVEQPESGEPSSQEEGLTLDGLEERLAAIERLMRKHGGSIERVLEHAERSRARRDELAGAEVALEQTTQELGRAQAVLDGHVQALRKAREAAAPLLEQGVREQLESLAMADASFEVTIAPREPGPLGGDAVDFLIAPNPGVPAGPLREIASGGELSRVMLALVTAARRAAPARQQAGETLVFDEIDAGIGGHAARAVGARLRELGEARQVLCITHLPQIASLGDRHFSIVKETAEELARTSVVQLGEREVVSELVRMLGADADDVAARRHARDLRKAA
ncbi:MAG TPA: DNA repair protein RecN [Solirubrobacteraceae bacterium]|jgi:DNA repair protein RecN (Recombination protein N)|nr:DNA repair protein RecN [Solirubrobacteraceae bacterium]